MDEHMLVTRVQSIIYAVRRGQSNQVLATFVLILIGAGEYLRREW